MSAIPPTWTPDRVAALKRLHEAGLTCSEMAREIGVTRNAVIGKISRLGLSRPQGEAPPRREPRAQAKPRRSQPRILRLLRAEAFSPAEDEPNDDGQRTSLFELSPQNCRWPIGSPGADDFGFCGNEPVAGFPYCPRHARMAYQSTARRVVQRS
jgi:GcrA cell cycle regulator